MKTTIDLPDELVREVKLRAVLQRQTVKDLVAEYIRQGLGMASPMRPGPPPAGSMVEIGEGGLPFIRCRVEAPAAGMRTEELLALEREAVEGEDLKRAGLSL